jgi:epoxyqueuosine reductase
MPPGSLALSRNKTRAELAVILDADSLKQLALNEGASLAGIARLADGVEHAQALESWTREGLYGPMEWWPRHNHLRLDARKLMPDALSVLMVAVSHSGRVSWPEDSDCKVARYAMGRDYHKVIRKLLKRVLQKVQASDTSIEGRICVDSAPFAERYWGWKAGLGWIGRNCMLIHPELGSWFLLGGLLINRELAADRPHPFYCGDCTACLEACPTGAFLEAGRLDAARCISAQTIENRAEELPESMQPMPDNWLFGCDICQEVCPWNRRDRGQAHPELAADESLLRQLASLCPEAGDDCWESLTRGRALRRMSPGMFKRNLKALRWKKESKS